MSDYSVYWGDFHTHLVDMENADEIVREGRENIDFLAVLSYPFRRENKNGLRIESVRNRPEFLENWKTHQRLCRDCYEPGRFTTFLGYEWHGDRTRYGDHNVIYFDHDGPLDDTWSLEDLYAKLRKRKAFAIPHHTGYILRHRGKDWSVYDEALSPVMEIFSGHRSSEGCNTPYPLERNESMGPRTTGGTFQDALAQGIRIGVIGSNDGATLPGRWNMGRAATLAKDCTREDIWEAVSQRRTYAVTGDRILLDVCVEGQPMGSVLSAGDAVDVDVFVVGTHAIDRVELIHNNVTADTYCHAGKWERSASEADRYKVEMELGWGPAVNYGFRPGLSTWQGEVRVEGGRISDWEKCFTLVGQSVERTGDASCAFRMASAGRIQARNVDFTQSLVLEVEGGPEARVRFDIEGVPVESSLGELVSRSLLVPLMDETIQRIRDVAGLDPSEIENPDIYYHNSRKIKIHKAIPEAGYKTAHTFRGVKLEPGRNWLYVRVSQLNGQLAWSSPIWVDKG